MSTADFKASLAAAAPAPALSPPLAALWWAAKGDWDAAHKIVQDENTRSNLAIMNPGSEEIRVRWQIVDESGAPFPESEDLVLAPGEWRQFGSVLAQYGSRRGWARIRSVGGPSVSPGVFFAYAVVNDGASAGTGTGGGTYVPMNPR